MAGCLWGSTSRILEVRSRRHIPIFVDLVGPDGTVFRSDVGYVVALASERTTRALHVRSLAVERHNFGHTVHNDNVFV